jgi:uncharacterized integral membrane protein
MKKYIKIILVVLILITTASCESYLEFEKARFKYIILPIFFGSLIIGILGYIFSKKD